MILRKAVRLFIIALPAIALGIVVPQSAEARNLFDFLFGRKKQEQPQVPATPKKNKPKRAKAATPQHKQNPKSADATRILVVGDFVAGAVVDGLNQIYTNNPDVVILSKTDSASGLIRTDRYNWPVNLPKIIEKEKPDVIVVSIGANDDHPIKIGGQTIAVAEPDWTSSYKQRVTSLADVLKNSGKPWIWMGQPAFKNVDLLNTIVMLNALYKQEAEVKGGRFVDVWEGFVDDQGKFSLSGYDVNGQTARLRANDGINFTSSGKQKLAFYLQKPLEIFLNNKNPGEEQNMAPDPKGPILAILPRNVDRVPPMNIMDMARQNNGLLGDLSTPQQPEKAEPWTPKNGNQPDRADNFTLHQ